MSPDVSVLDTVRSVRRFGRTALLRSGTEAEYDRLHAAVWPEVRAAIARVGIRNYSIFRHGQRLFSYFEVEAGCDLKNTTSALLADAACRNWEDAMQELQAESEDGGDWWKPMKEVFHLP